jgi:hypothetical protein
MFGKILRMAHYNRLFNLFANGIADRADRNRIQLQMTLAALFLFKGRMHVKAGKAFLINLIVARHTVASRFMILRSGPGAHGYNQRKH